MLRACFGRAQRCGSWRRRYAGSAGSARRAADGVLGLLDQDAVFGVTVIVPVFSSCRALSE